MNTTVTPMKPKMIEQDSSIPASTTTPKEWQVDVLEQPIVAQWMLQLAQQDPDAFVRLIRPNQALFKALWGKPRWKNSKKKDWQYGWVVRDQGLAWVILTGIHGTQFRLRISDNDVNYLQDPRVGSGATAFLQKLVQVIVETANPAD